jgi:hypothetical protein
VNATCCRAVAAEALRRGGAEAVANEVTQPHPPEGH